jgi:inosine-uridine nucleoside N-ribohydrolase
VPRPLILDVDTGVDDLVALAYAAASPEVELIGATTVFGNVDIERTVRNTALALDRCGLGGAEVARGAGSPLQGSWTPFPIVHGEEGLGSFVPTGEVRAPSARGAATLIVEEARARPGDVLLVAVGPLTNVALALELEPRLPELLGGFTLMGGAYREGGNVAPRAEANVWMDAVAAARVFAAWSGAEALPRCLGLDVTERVPMSKADLATVCAPAPASGIAELLDAALGFYIDFHLSIGRAEGGYLHDPLAVAAAIDPSLCSWTETRVEVELEGRWTRGETVTDLQGIRGTPWSDWDPAPNATVATDVDAERAIARIVDRLAGLVGSRR